MKTKKTEESAGAPTRGKYRILIGYHGCVCVNDVMIGVVAAVVVAAAVVNAMKIQ